MPIRFGFKCSPLSLALGQVGVQCFCNPNFENCHVVLGSVRRAQFKYTCLYIYIYTCDVCACARIHMYVNNAHVCELYLLPASFQYMHYNMCCAADKIRCPPYQQVGFILGTAPNQDEQNSR